MRGRAGCSAWPGVEVDLGPCIDGRERGDGAPRRGARGADVETLEDGVVAEPEVDGADGLGSVGFAGVEGAFLEASAGLDAHGPAGAGVVKEPEAEPVPGGLGAVGEDDEPLTAGGPELHGGDGEVDAAVAVEVEGDGIALVGEDGGAEEPCGLAPSVAMLIEEEGSV